MSLLDAALQYQQRGFHPIPLEPRGKRPLVPWRMYQDMPPARAEVERWWTENPEANVGLVLGRGTFAVDCDSAEAWALVQPLLPADTPVSKTAKGFHAFLRGTLPDRVGVLPGVDVRGVGYVVAPPSIHETGHVYAWLGADPAPVAWPEAPAPLLGLLAPAPQAPVESRGPGGWVLEALAGVGEGGRDATCTRLAGYLLGKNLPPDVVEALLLEWAGRCTPPFPEAEVRKCVASIAKRGGAEPAEPPKRLADVLRFLNTMAGHGAQRRAPTPFLALSHLLSGGFLPGELIYLGARPGLGKTSLALQLARATAEAGQGVLFVSREMTPEALVRRLVAQAGMLRAERFRAGDLDDVERRLLQEACAELAPLPLWVTSDVVTIDEIHDAVRDHEGEALGLVVVDYLQLVRGPSDLRDRRLAVEFVSQGLKSLAVTYRLPVLALSSLARPPREARNYRHGLNDLRESGELEHDADLVLFLHADRENPDNRELTIAKHRDGATGSLALRFQGEYVRFLEV